MKVCISYCHGETNSGHIEILESKDNTKVRLPVQKLFSGRIHFIVKKFIFWNLLHQPVFQRHQCCHGSHSWERPYFCSHISRAANGKTCAVFHTSGKSGVAGTCYDIEDVQIQVPTNIGSIEVAPGGFLDFCLRFRY